MTNWPDQLYRLLPAVHQIRDGEQGEALRAWLTLVGEQVRQLQDDVEQLYDNWFIETCDEWAVPYLGDLVGFRRTGAGGAPADAVDARGRLLNRFLYPRREIANLVRRRRRKGTLSVLEDMAKDVSGWSARAVEFSRLVLFFQNVKRPQPNSGLTFSFRKTACLSRVNTPFDTSTAHTVDVRGFASQPGVGWYHPRHLGLFVWRRKSLSATRVCPCRKSAGTIPYYTFNRTGIESPLAICPVDEPDELHIADETNLPGLLFRHLLANERGRANEKFYGFGESAAKSLGVFVSWECGKPAELLPAENIHVCDLRPERLRDVSLRLPANEAAVDPERGILLFGCNCQPADVEVSYHYSATMEFGGGEYERAVIDPPGFRTVRLRQEGCCPESGPPNLFAVALAALGQTVRRPCSDVLNAEAPLTRANEGAGADECAATWFVRDNLCIELTDSDTFGIPANEKLQIAAGKTLVIRAAQKVWPMVHVQPTGPHPCQFPWRVLMERGSKLVVDGLLIAGVTIEFADVDSDDPATAPAVTTCRPCDAAANGAASRRSAELGEIHFRHTTFVPGETPHWCMDSLSLKASQAKLVVRHSTLGPLNVEQTRCAGSCGGAKAVPCPSDPTAMEITDSLIIAVRDMAIYSHCCPCAHAEMVVERSTILGDVCVQQISRAENSLFAGIVHVQRRGVGYMRFCYVPHDESTAAAARVPTLERMSAAATAECCNVVRTPPRFKCVPQAQKSIAPILCRTGCDAESTPIPQPTSVPLPRFVNTEYGKPGFAELSLDCDARILRGAEDESEVGVFHDLFRPQRDAALRSRLQEYTPAEMESAVIYADDLQPWK